MQFVYLQKTLTSTNFVKYTKDLKADLTYGTYSIIDQTSGVDQFALGRFGDH